LWDEAALMTVSQRVFKAVKTKEAGQVATVGEYTHVNAALLQECSMK
jgi:hypothetical protein